MHIAWVPSISAHTSCDPKHGCALLQAPNTVPGLIGGETMNVTYVSVIA